MLSKTDVEKLKYFNEKALILKDSQFLKWFLNKNKLNFNLKLIKDFETVQEDDDGMMIISDYSSEYPEEESLRALILTVRFFIQNKENISIQNMNNFYGQINIEEKYKINFNNIYKDLSTYWDSYSGIKQYSNREIFDIYIYGDLAHSNPDKKEIYDQLQKDFFTQLYSDFQFIHIVVNFTRFILRLKRLNQQVLDSLEDS